MEAGGFEPRDVPRKIECFRYTFRRRKPRDAAFWPHRGPAPCAVVSDIPDCPVKSLRIPKKREPFPVSLRSEFASKTIADECEDGDL